MYAIINTGGKQYKAEVGNLLKIEKLDANIGDSVSFDNVLLFCDGKESKIGTPVLENFSVNGKIVDQTKSKKTIVFKYKRRKGYRRKRGHRQDITMVRIESIKGDL